MHEVAKGARPRVDGEPSNDPDPPSNDRGYQGVRYLQTMTTIAQDKPKQTLWERRRQLVSLEIERAALGAFAEFGYQNVTIDQIATSVGMTVRTFYRYFASKEEVLLAMPRRVTSNLCAAVRARPADEGIVESYRQAIAAKADASEDDERIALQWREIFKQSSGLPWMVTHSSVMSNIVSVIAERLGVGDDDLRPLVIAAAITSAVDVGLARWLANGGADDRQRYMIEALDVLESLSSTDSKGGPGSESSKGRKG